MITLDNDHVQDSNSNKGATNVIFKAMYRNVRILCSAFFNFVPKYMYATLIKKFDGIVGGV